MERVQLLKKLMLTGLLILIDSLGSIFQAFCGGCVAFMFFAVQCSARPYANTEDNILKAVAEAQLFVTLFISVVLRTDLAKDALTEDNYGAVLIGSFMAAPSVQLLFTLNKARRTVSAKIKKRRQAYPAPAPSADSAPAPTSGEPTSAPSNGSAPAAEKAPLKTAGSLTDGLDKFESGEARRQPRLSEDIQDFVAGEDPKAPHQPPNVPDSTSPGV